MSEMDYLRREVRAAREERDALRRLRGDDNMIQRFCGEPGMPSEHRFEGGSCTFCPTAAPGKVDMELQAWHASRVWSPGDERHLRAVTEERDQLRQKVAYLEEVRGELLERLDGVERARLIEARQRLSERKRLARQQQYRAFRDR